MKKMIALFALAIAVLVSAPPAEAQKPGKIPRIGILLTVKSYLADAFLESLRELGYIEGKNILIESRQNKGKIDVSKEMADFVRLKVDVIVVHGGRAIKAAKQATDTIPIVSTYGPDLVRRGWVTSVTKPGGNITGSYTIVTDDAGKRVELLLEVLPKASRIAVLGHPVYPKAKYTASVKSARQLGMKVQSVKVSDQKEIQSAYAAMTEQKAGGAIIIRGPFTAKNSKMLLELATRNRLPTMCEDSGWVRRGCLLSYGPSHIAMHRRAAYFVDKILKGANPGDIPMERPKEFELTVNLKTAKKLGITIPPEVLLRATKVVK